MPHPLDHVMWAARDLDGAEALLHRLTGVTPARGGRHGGRGTRNALAGLGDGVYLEVLGTDPEQDVAKTWGAELLPLDQPQLHLIIGRAGNLAKLRDVYAAAGVPCQGPFMATRNAPDGTVLKWELLIPQASKWGRAAPCFIDWLDTPHPSLVTPKGCTLRRFEVGHPDAEALADLYGALDFAVPVVSADRFHFRAELDTPNGRVVLTG